MQRLQRPVVAAVAAAAAATPRRGATHQARGTPVGWFRAFAPRRPGCRRPRTAATLLLQHPPRSYLRPATLSTDPKLKLIFEISETFSFTAPQLTFNQPFDATPIPSTLRSPLTIGKQISNQMGVSSGPIADDALDDSTLPVTGDARSQAPKAGPEGRRIPALLVYRIKCGGRVGSLSSMEVSLHVYAYTSCEVPGLPGRSQRAAGGRAGQDECQSKMKLKATRGRMHFQLAMNLLCPALCR